MTEQLKQYSPLFQTIEDNDEFSIVRGLAHKTPTGQLLSKPFYRDVCIVWDEDKDSRIIGVLEGFVGAGVFSNVLAVSESKGIGGVIYEVPSGFLRWDAVVTELSKAAEQVIQNELFTRGDPWSYSCGITELKNLDDIWSQSGMDLYPFDKLFEGEHLSDFLKQVHAGFQLGTKPFTAPCASRLIAEVSAEQE